VPIIIYLPTPTSAVIRSSGLEALGGNDFEKRVDEEAARLDISPDELGDKVRFSSTIMSR